MSATVEVISSSQDALPVCLCPRQENPYGLVSLWDILNHYNVWQLAKAIAEIDELKCLHDNLVMSGNGDRLVERPWIEIRVSPFIHYCRLQCVQLELQAAIERLDGPLHVGLRDGITNRDLATELRVLRESIEGELQYRRFAFVPTEKAKIYDNLDHDWDTVWKKLPDTKVDSTEAVECYVLGKATASVFHSMRVAEYCLRGLARRLKVRLTHRGKAQPIEFAEWQKLIDGCNCQLTSARALSPGARRQGQLELYSDAAQHCVFMKDIWRNNVSHTRTAYIDSEALTVLNRVLEFARFVATRVLK